MFPVIITVPPGETVSWWCSCQTICGGGRADNPACEMHHPQHPGAIYVMTIR